ncbi:hypothetical protein OAG38_02945 [Akkermansiaceae bacterium]|nr:hypothetical protein [Akkermansiaceae bacterium]
MKLSNVKIKMLSKLGQRGSIFGISALDPENHKKDIVISTADLAFLSGLERFSKKYPEKLVNVGIAEQNLLGVSAGMANEGKIVVATTYATFITMRSCEQLRHYLGYMESNVKIVGSGAGLVQGFSGNTHYTIEDISMTRCIPNLTVISPADATEAIKAFEASINNNHPTYLRLTGALNIPIVYTQDYNFVIGDPIQILKGDKMAVFATGTMVGHALRAIEFIRERFGLNIALINVHTLKPVNEDRVEDFLLRYSLLVSVEEHNVLGGLGSIVSEIITKNGLRKKLIRMGIEDSFEHCGDYEYNLDKHGLSSDKLADRFLSILNSEDA